MNETLEDELERASLERKGIVKKYKLGRNSENKINQWVRVEAADEAADANNLLNVISITGRSRFRFVLQD
jgi:hypothetical protein